MDTPIVEFENFLKGAQIPIRLAVKTQSGWPLILSLWFIYQDGLLFCATQSSAKVVQYLQNDPQCAFEIASDKPPYCGIRGQATASINADLGPEILKKLLVRYTGDDQSKFASKLLVNRKNEVAIILKPVNIFSWDFSKRMKTLPALTPKICP